MKKILLILAVLIFASNVEAQQTLRFGEVQLKDTLNGQVIIKDASSSPPTRANLYVGSINVIGTISNISELQAGTGGMSLQSSSFPSHNIVLNSDGSTVYGAQDGQAHTFEVNSTEVAHFDSDGLNVTGLIETEDITVSGLIQGTQGTLASATNMGVPTANFITVSGTTNISTMSTTGIQAGTQIILRFGGSLTITHSGVEGGFALTGSVNKAVTAGQRALFVLFDAGGTKYWLQTSAFITD